MKPGDFYLTTRIIAVAPSTKPNQNLVFPFCEWFLSDRYEHREILKSVR